MIWKDIIKRFLKRTPPKRMLLQRKLDNITYAGLKRESIPAFFKKAKTLAMHFRAVGGHTDDEHLVSVISQKLLPHFKEDVKATIATPGLDSHEFESSPMTRVELDASAADYAQVDRAKVMMAKIGDHTAFNAAGGGRTTSPVTKPPRCEPDTRRPYPDPHLHDPHGKHLRHQRRD